ncbi:hypothetical protein ABZW18_00460 [Streptomyces sp. NPDC004647]|uniref:hypothetical protein n=1 Tax=Streptomyces sp. NPDC004647 TaxID=3154671 RepID=UPI00339F9C7A
MAISQPASESHDGHGSDGNIVQAAIRWFDSDTAPTPQVSRRGIREPRAPGTLLSTARAALELDQLRPGAGHQRHGSAEEDAALVQAQVNWLIRRLPAEHHPTALDSAQQVGRAWGVLIGGATSMTGEAGILPTDQVLAAFRHSTNLTLEAAEELVFQARETAKAFNRADALAPYDHTSQERLIVDWHRLAACGPELPDAARLAEDVLELLEARASATIQRDWMTPSEQFVADRYETLARLNTTLEPLARLLPAAPSPASTAILVQLAAPPRQDELTEAATAAARARAVADWFNRKGAAEPSRPHIVEAVVPRMRTITNLSIALDHLLHPGRPTGPDPLASPRVTEVLRRLTALPVPEIRLPQPPSTGRHPTPGHTDQHQHPPSTGPSGPPLPGP